MVDARRSKTWPAPSPGPRFSTLPVRHTRTKQRRRDPHNDNRTTTTTITTPHHHSRRGIGGGDGIGASWAHPRFADLPFELLARIAAPLDVPELWSASMVCRSWREALRPLREAMVLLRWGKRFKHGHGGGAVRPDPQRALDSFLKGAARGSAAAMVDAGLMYWEMGRKEEGVALYRRAAELGHPAGQCNLGICYLEADPQESEEAVKWFYRAAKSGYARAQYNLALCLHRGRGVNCNVPHAAKWYLKAAEGGYARAMYNTSLCYSTGDGLPRSTHRAKTWMKRAADYGHRKAQFEYGLQLFSSGDMPKALIYLELATRAGVIAASHIRNVVHESISLTSRDRAMESADRWQPLHSRRFG